jgi:hypothetical protein
MTDLVIRSQQDKLSQAQLLADASLIPQAYRKNPANVFVAIEYGEALGIHPMVALSEINVIQGTPSLSASLMASLARNAGHKVRVYGDNTQATCEIVRHDDPEFTHTATWTEAKARAAGLWGKGHWGKDPGTMLRWRAISECVRFACSEVLGGIKYTPEEVRDFSPADAPQNPTQPPQQAPVTIRRQAPAEDITVEEVPAADVDRITEEQWATLNDWLDHHGIEDKAGWVSGRVDYALSSPMDLTNSAAAAMIEELSNG